MSCPYCGGTDVGHTMKGQGICLDCERVWTPGSVKREKKAREKMDWFDRINT